MISENDVQFVRVDEETLRHFLEMAESRIIIAKPGYSLSEIETILKLVSKKNLICKVYVDPGENAVRWGFGEKAALQKLQEYTEILNVQTVDHIRMSVVIVDERSLIYAPVALSWEDEPNQLTFPNGFIGDMTVTNSLLEQINSSEKDSTSLPKIIDIFTRCPIPNKETIQTKTEINQTIEKLEKNPPINPSNLRKITVYSNNYKILKFQMLGIKIKNKSISLKPFNKLFAELDERLKASWRVFTRDDMDDVVEIQIFLYEVASILDELTLDVGRFGALIKTEDKVAFEKKIDSEKKEFLKALSIQPGQKIENTKSKYYIQNKTQESLFQQANQPGKKSLAALIEQSREALKDYMQQMIKDNEESLEGLFINDRTLLGMVRNNKITLDEVMPRILDSFINDKLKFPKAKDLIEKMDVQFDYYDVSNELLYENSEFKVMIEKIRSSAKSSDNLKIRAFSDVFKEYK